MSTLRHNQSVFVSGLLVLIIGMLFNYSTNIDRLWVISVSDHQVNAANNSIDQIIKQRNITSNQSSDLRDIRKLTSEEVRLPRELGQGFNRTTTQSQFSFRYLPFRHFLDYLWIKTNCEGNRQTNKQVL